MVTLCLQRIPLVQFRLPQGNAVICAHIPDGLLNGRDLVQRYFTGDQLWNDGVHISREIRRKTGVGLRIFLCQRQPCGSMYAASFWQVQTFSNARVS